LGQIADPSSLRDLEKATSDATPEVRANAAYRSGSSRPVGAGGARAADRRRLAEVRAAAVEALGRLHDAAGAPTVRAMLDDPEMPVRAAAALGA